MALQGMGKCLITIDGTICGRQIGEGEPIGTVIPLGGQPITGHKTCADRYHAFKQAKEREQREAMVQKITQSPGGPVDPRNAEDMISGSIPLDRTPGQSSPPPGADQANLNDYLSAQAASGYEGIRSAAEVPFEEDHPIPAPQQPLTAVNPVATLAERQEQARAHQQRAEAARSLPGMMPWVAEDGAQVVIRNLPLTGEIHLSPEDSDDLAQQLQLFARRAIRNRNAGNH